MFYNGFKKRMAQADACASWGDHMASLPARPLELGFGTPTLQGGGAALGPAPAMSAAAGGYNSFGLLGAGAGAWAAAGAYSYYVPGKWNGLFKPRDPGHWWSTSQQRYYNGNSFTGNQWTNDGMRGAKGISNAFRGFGYGLGIYNAYSIEQQYTSGQINRLQRGLEQGSNVVSIVGGIYGAAWGIGWELGRVMTGIPGYHEYIRVPGQRLLGIRP